jgi:putative cardiolipin synthase
VRLAADGSGDIEWLTMDDDGEMVLHEEPDTGLWDRIALDLLAPFAPEELL